MTPLTLPEVLYCLYGLTERQADVLLAILDHRRRHGWSPTVRELADRLGLATHGIVQHANALVRKGALRKGSNQARSLVPTVQFIPARELYERLGS